MHGTETKRSVHERLNEALAAYERALELNPTLSEAYRGYGFNLMWFQLYPDPAVGWLEAWRAGRWEVAFDKGLEIDPLSIPLHAIKSWYPITVGSKEQAKWHAHRMIEIAPDPPRGYETVAEQGWGGQRPWESIRKYQDLLYSLVSHTPRSATPTWRSPISIWQKRLLRLTTS